jgi:hypothetical protein
MPNYHVTQLTPEAAEAHTRRSMNIPANCLLGWVPYNYLITRNAISHTAFHKAQDFDQWRLANGFAPPAWGEWSNGIRSAFLEPA